MVNYSISLLLNISMIVIFIVFLLLIKKKNYILMYSISLLLFFFCFGFIYFRSNIRESVDSSYYVIFLIVLYSIGIILTIIYTKKIWIFLRGKFKLFIILIDLFYLISFSFYIIIYYIKCAVDVIT